MSFFPLSMDMKDLKVLLVGGGTIASEKLEKLLDFTQDITVIANDLSDPVHTYIREYALSFYQRAYKKGDIEGFDMVIIATDTQDLHQEIYEESRGESILVNSVDNMKYCDFIFPSYIKKGDLTIAFSTGGASPAFAKHLRQYFAEHIPDTVESFLEKMKSLRTTMPKGKDRMAYFDTLVKAYFAKYFK